MNRYASTQNFMEYVQSRNVGQPEFHQAVEEVIDSLLPVVQENKEFQEAKILERVVEPDRIVSFRVVWYDDKGEAQVNRGYRVQFNNAIGPYKGGLRFDPSVNVSILKFLAFEQIFKNSLTTLPLGAGKGGADFDPKGKSNLEIMRFCQSFMNELAKYIGPDIDVPAGDIGVGGREIGYLFGQYKKIRQEFTGALTGKGPTWGGSLIRPEATGYGAVYFARNMLKFNKKDIAGMECAISGSGNVALYAAEKIIQLGGKVLTLSDSKGFIFDKDGINAEKLNYLHDLKTVRRGPLKEFAEKFNVEYHEGKKPWGVKCDLAFPCATQNELNGEDAKLLTGNGCFLVSEGANMPSTPEAIEVYKEMKVLYGPGKAANAGGVAVSGLEMAQNSMRHSWSREEVEDKLACIMSSIHDSCIAYGQTQNGVDYLKGANIAGFMKVAKNMVSFGVM
jgi:glutamate dehydrogenase (NADP+)